MAPESRNKSSNPIQRLLETEEKGRGLALFGWAGVTVFAFLAAFASWQFAPGRAVSHLARIDDAAAGDITGGIRPSTRTTNVPTVPTPLPGDASLSKGDVDQLRADLKDLRRMVGRIDVSTDVLARRISNLEDSVASAPTASLKPLPKPTQTLTPITPTVPLANASPATAVPAAAPTVSANAVSPSSTVPASTQAPPAPAPAAAAPPVAPPPTVASAPQPVSVVPQNAPQSHPVANPPLRPPSPSDQQAEKTQFDRNAADRSQLERMLLQRAQGLDSDAGTDGNTYIPPLPDPISIVPKSKSPLVMPPQPLPMQPPAQPPGQPVVKAEPKPAPAPDATTTGSVTPRPVLPIDPTKAVQVKPPAAAELSPEEQKKATEKMALAMRDEQAAAKPPAPAPAPEPMGIDLGGYKSISQVKKVWSDLEMRQGKLAKALTPLARLGEATDGVEIRLIAGPFLDKEQAVRTCHQLRGSTAKCETVAYSGESILSKPTTPEAEHKPTAPEFAKRPPLKLDLPNKPLPPNTPTP